jgi:hypothetical protein
MSAVQREEKGITAAQARQILGCKVTRTLPCRLMAQAADGRDSTTVTAEHAAPLAPKIASTGGRALKSQKVQIPGGGEGWVGGGGV